MKRKTGRPEACFRWELYYGVGLYYRRLGSGGQGNASVITCAMMPAAACNRRSGCAQDLQDQIRHVAVRHRRWDAAAKSGNVVAVSVTQHQRIDDAGDVVGAAIQRRRRCAVTLGQQGLAGQDLRYRVRRPGRAGQHGNSQSRGQDKSHGASNYDEAPGHCQEFHPDRVEAVVWVFMPSRRGRFGGGAPYPTPAPPRALPGHPLPLAVPRWGPKRRGRAARARTSKADWRSG